MSSFSALTLDQFLHIAYQGGQLGLSGFGLIFVALNPFWFPKKFVLIGLLSIYTALLISSSVGLARNYYITSDVQQCIAYTMVDIVFYTLHIQIIVAMIIYRLIVVFSRKFVWTLIGMYLGVTLVIEAGTMLSSEPYLSASFHTTCKTGIPTPFFSLDDAIRLITELFVVILFTAYLIKASKHAELSLSEKMQRFYRVRFHS